MPRYHVCRRTTKLGLETVAPRIEEINSVNVCNDVDPQGWQANLKDRSGFTKIVDGQIGQRRAKVIERLYYSRGISRIRTDPHVEILRCAHMTMRGECMGADDEILNVARVEGE